MKLDVLSQAQGQLKRLSQHRHGQSQKYTEEGLALFQQALAQIPADREALKQACSLFIQAIQQQRTAPDPYLALATLYILLNKKPSALRLLRVVLTFSPGNPEAQELLTYIQSEAVSVPAPQSEQDAEEQYELLSRQINELLRTVLQKEKQYASFSTSSANIEALFAQAQDFQNKCQDLTKQIQILAQEIETTTLFLQIQPIQDRIVAFQKKVTAYQEMLVLQADLAELKQRIHSLEDKVDNQALQPSEVQILESELELCLDKMDAIADALDVFQEQGLSIDMLEAEYVLLVQAIEGLQDQLDT